MYPVPREYSNGAELVREARAVRERLWPMPVLLPVLETRQIPKSEPPAPYVVLAIYDDVYADMLQGWCRPAETKSPKIEDIQRIVARHYSVTRRDLISARRTANVVLPRQVAMYLVRMLTLRSLPEIGRLFGKRDHTTVMHAVRKIALNIKRDIVFAAEIAEFVRQIEEWSVEPRAQTGG